MVLEEVLEEFNHEVKADKNYAQLLIEISPSSEAFEEATKIIQDLGVHLIETKHLSGNWMLVKLDVKDMRNVALQLTEHGFLNIKGINAIP
jgi:hypothetical protein